MIECPVNLGRMSCTIIFTIMTNKIRDVLQSHLSSDRHPCSDYDVILNIVITHESFGCLETQREEKEINMWSGDTAFCPNR